MASQDIIQETEGDYRNSKGALVKGVRMNYLFAYKTGFEDFLDKFQTRHDDVFLVGHPRSGTTWLSEITWQICNDGNTSTEPIGNRVLFFDQAKCLDIIQPDVMTQPSPRLMKTHLPYHVIPKGTTDATRCKYIYVVRNPKDAVVSYYNFKCKMAPMIGYSGPFEFFAKMYLEGKANYGCWSEHVLDWLEHREDDNVLFLKYEDIVKDLLSHIRLISDFLDKSLSEEVVNRIAKQCAFGEMVNNAAAFDWKWAQNNKHTNFLGKGQAGGWKEYFTPELSAKFESEFFRKLEGTGLNFDPDD